MQAYQTYLITGFWFSSWLLTLLRTLLTPNPNLATNKYGFALVTSVKEKHQEDEVTSLRIKGKIYDGQPNGLCLIHALPQTIKTNGIIQFKYEYFLVNYIPNLP
jgi:hypothetical protein